MNNKLGVLGFMVMMVACSGCYTTGLSLREKGEHTYSNYILSLYNEERLAVAVSDLCWPLRLAVAQIGEGAPHQDFMQIIEESQLPVRDLIGVPAGGSDGDKKEDRAEVESVMKKMMQLARAQGAEYLVVYGGSAEVGEESTPLSLMDMTIVGGFIFNGQKIQANSRAMGALIDLKTGQLVFTVNAQRKDSYAYPTLLYGRGKNALSGFRDQLVKDLAGKLVVKLENYL